MLDIIVLIIVIKIVTSTIKKQKENIYGNQKPGQPMQQRPSVKLDQFRREKASEKPSHPRRQEASARPNQPRKEDRGVFAGKFFGEQKKKDTYMENRKVPLQERGQNIMQKVNEHIYGTDANTADLMLYKNYLEVERRTDIKKMARDMECTMYQVIREIRDFQQMGYFQNVEIDDSNYVIRYKDSPVRERSQPSQSSGSYSKGASKKENARAQKDAREQKKDLLERHKEHESLRPMDCEDCGTAPAQKTWTSPYITMPEHGLDIGYMTMTEDYTVNYMTMPEHGLTIGYNTIPELSEDI